MELHLSHSALVSLFSGEADRPEVDAAVPHLVRCRPCMDRTAGAVAELKRAGRLARPEDARSAILTLLEVAESYAESRLLARAAWAELQGLSSEEQIERIRTEPALQTFEMFEVLIEEAASLAPHDPFLGEETALAAHALAGGIPRMRFSQALRNDLLGEAMGTVGNCRRLAADWRGCANALGAARKHLDQGTGKPAREARLLSLQASLATDTGNLEQAQTLLARAAELHCNAGDRSALASITLKMASALLAARRHEEAVARADEALSLLTPRETRLEMLARNVITECLVFLGRPASALKNHLAARPLRDLHRQKRTELQSEYLEALLLDSLDHAREAEKAFRSNIASRMEAEHYKDAFLTLLTRFELLYRRGETDKASRACEEAVEMIRQAAVACHGQMEELWRRLLAIVHARQLTEHHLLAARHYLLRHWNAPAKQAPLEQAAGSQGAAVLPRQRSTTRVPRPLAAGTAGEGAYEGDDHATALERHDRALVAVGLAQCRGNFTETSGLLGISRTTLRSRIVRYGLTAVHREANCDEDDAGLDALQQDDRKAVGWLRARAWRAELGSLPISQQLARIGTVHALRSRELFEMILEEAEASAPGDPRRAEETASVAYALAGFLPARSCPVPVKHDLMGAARWVAGNCRRLRGDWQGSAAAFEAARSHLDRGTGDPSREARLLSLEASLAADMGRHAEALALVSCASSLYRSIEHEGGVAATAVKEASVLLAANRFAEAISRAEAALRLLSPREPRLELLARSVITECLVFLGRPAEALRSLQAARPLYEQLRGGQSELLLTYLEALVLDSRGLEQQAEAVFRANVAARMEAGLYKDAFLTLMTRIELRFRRGELDKAALACEEAIAMMSGAGDDRHAQAIDLFRELLGLLADRRLTEPRLLETQHALLRCWAAPETAATPEPASRRGRTFVAPELPPVPARLAPGDYEAARERYEREVILAGLAQAGGSINEACRLLGIAKNTLRERMSRYGLREPAEPDPSKPS